jgi:hypothetical protein
MPAMPTLLTRKDNGYTDAAQERKLTAHKSSMALMRKLATGLGLVKGTFDVRSNKAGIACPGEVTLHGERIYVQIGGYGGILARRCKGRKDYTGEANHFYPEESLLNPENFAARLRHDLRLASEVPQPDSEWQDHHAPYWAHQPFTGEERHFRKGEAIPIGWRTGRKPNPAREALTQAVNRAMENGQPAIVEQPAPISTATGKHVSLTQFPKANMKRTNAKAKPTAKAKANGHAVRKMPVTTFAFLLRTSDTALAERQRTAFAAWLDGRNPAADWRDEWKVWRTLPKPATPDLSVFKTITL